MNNNINTKNHNHNNKPTKILMYQKADIGTIFTYMYDITVLLC